MIGTVREPRLPPELDAELLSFDYLVDPYPIYARIRAEGPPVAWSDSLKAWVVTGYDDVLWASRDPRLLVGPRMPTLMRQLPDEQRATAQPVIDHYAQTLAFSDPPRHTAVRTILQRVFSASAIEALRPHVERLVDAHLDAAGPDEADLMPALAYPLPVDVIGEMLGVPPPDRAQFRPWTDHILGIFSTSRATPEATAPGLRSLAEMRAYLGRLIDERAQRPEDDLISWLVEQERQGELTHLEVIANCVMLYTAGHATTSGMIGNAFLTLFQHPADLHRLRDEPALIENAVEELIRFRTSVQRGWRVAAEDIEHGSCRIMKGDPVWTVLGSANHDPSRFEQPEGLDIERQRNRHMAFGQGIHFCLGAGLARLEVGVAITTFLRRFPNATLIEEGVRWDAHMGMGSSLSTLVALPVRLH